MYRLPHHALVGTWAAGEVELGKWITTTNHQRDEKYAPKGSEGRNEMASRAPCSGSVPRESSATRDYSPHAVHLELQPEERRPADRTAAASTELPLIVARPGPQQVQVAWPVAASRSIGPASGLLARRLPPPPEVAGLVCPRTAQVILRRALSDRSLD